MSRKRPEDFAEDFFLTIRRVADGDVVHIPLPVPEANNLRASFYHFRRVLKDNNHEAYDAARMCKFSVDGTGLVIYKRGQAFPETSVDQVNLPTSNR